MVYVYYYNEDKLLFQRRDNPPPRIGEFVDTPNHRYEVIFIANKHVGTGFHLNGIHVYMKDVTQK